MKVTCKALNKELENDINRCFEEACPIADAYDEKIEAIAKIYQEKIVVATKVCKDKCDGVVDKMKLEFMALNKPYDEKIEALKKEISGEALKKEIDCIEKIIYDKSQPIEAFHKKVVEDFLEQYNKEIKALEEHYTETIKPLETVFKKRMHRIFGHDKDTV